ncbi:MAG: hypothetical protein Aureis2KO_16360 [Aureisphaera sp.]
MKKSITISIPEPCHEDWGKMTATEKGRFCKVCTKEVIDFTQTSDEALFKRLQNGEKLCGRFQKTQLNRPIALARKSKNSILPYAASLLLPLSILSPQETKAQGGVSLHNTPGIDLSINAHTEKSIVTITGQVTDEFGTPLPAVEVMVLETSISAWTDFDGNYTLQCPSGSTLSFIYEDKIPYEVTVGTKNSVVHALLNGEVPATEEILIRPYIVGKIAPVKVTEEITEKKQDSTIIIINGTITDEMDYPFPGVNVMVKGTSEGTITDFDGNYTIEVDANQTLVFSYISYVTREVTLSNIPNEISFSMDPDENMVLGGMVTVGMVATISEREVVESPLEREASWDNEQWDNQQKRREYAAKENAFKKIQMERAKEARKLKRERRRKK